jgi:hypothetical protein
MKRLLSLTFWGVLAVAAAGVSASADAQVNGPKQRWGADAVRRPLTVDRPLDFRRKPPPVRVVPKVKPVDPPYLKAAPRYGEPEPAIERIPET